MKKILILSNTMELGGAEKSLLGLLEAFDYENYEVSLFLLRLTGELLEDIPKSVNVMDEIKPYAALKMSIRESLRNGQWCVLLGRMMGKILAKRYAKRFESSTDVIVEMEYQQKYSLWALPRISDEVYDLVISFMAPHHIAVEKVKAKKYLAWVHTDYTKMKLDIMSETKMWGKYDNIVAVSEEVAERFQQVFPNLRNKVLVSENILSKKYVLKKAGEFSAEKEMPKDGTIRLLSIGRFCTAKNFDNVPEICRMIRNNGLQVKWYLIGFGGGIELIKKKIIENQMEEYVIVLGKKVNPYPYIKECDLYVQPSRFEGKSVCVREAQMLEKPVIITCYDTSPSQLKNGVDGAIVPLDNLECADGMTRLILNQEKLFSFARKCKHSDYSNSNEIKKIYSLLE